MEEKRILIAGGGITGLSAAYYAQKFAKQRGLSCRITLVEKAPVLGGKIHTMYRDGFVIEKGPDSFLARKLPIIDLTRDLGLEGELTGLNPQAKKTYILRKGRLHRMPPGLVLGIPTEIAPFMKTGLISPLGKARAALDMVLPKRNSTDDESLGRFLERRLGKEVLNNIAEPLLAGIYAGDTHALSLKATFPQFQEMEQKHRSLILGMMASRKNAQQEAAKLPAAAKGSAFLTYKKGLQTLVEALVAVLNEEGVELKTKETVTSFEKLDDGTYRVTLQGAEGDGRAHTVDGIILTLPAYATARLLTGLPAAKSLADIDYISVANVILAFDEKEVDCRMDGSGFLVPRTEGLTITACTWTSVKWLHTAPEGKILLRCYVGRSGEEDWVKLSDEELVQAVRKDIRTILGIAAEPLFYEVTRLPESMPQYPVGHLDNIAELRKQLEAFLPGVYATGAGFQGVGLPDCIRQGKETAEQLVCKLAER
jgi:oxygen-dependent protoporphyrinogen oxidase